MKVKSYNGVLISVPVFNMKVSEVVQLCAYATFFIITFLLTRFFKKSSNKRHQSWSDIIVWLFLTDCLLILLKILNIVTFWNYDYTGISAYILGFICKVFITLTNSTHWKIEKFVVVSILGMDFVLMLYYMGFKYSTQAQSGIFILFCHASIVG